MTCRYAVETLVLYVEGDLTAARHEAVKAHVAGCPACSRICRELLESQSLLKSLRHEPVDPSILDEARRNIFAVIDSDEDTLGWAVKAERVVLSGLRGRPYALAGSALIATGLVIYGLFGLSGMVEDEDSPIMPRAELAGASSQIDLDQPERAAVPDPVASDMESDRTILAGASEIEVVKPVLGPQVQEGALDALPESTETLPADAPDPKAEQVLVRVLTDNPKILIYWLLDGSGGGV